MCLKRKVYDQKYLLKHDVMMKIERANDSKMKNFTKRNGVMHARNK